METNKKQTKTKKKQTTILNKRIYQKYKNEVQWTRFPHLEAKIILGGLTCRYSQTINQSIVVITLLK